MRDFIYLDERLVDQYLAQVEDGLYDDERERQGNTTSRGLEAAMRAGPAHAGAKRSKDSVTDIDRVRRQTPESRFNRLVEHLNLTRVDDSTSQVYGLLNARAMVEVECYVDVPTIARVLAQGPELAGLADIATSIGETVDDDTAEMIQGITAIASRSEGSVIATGESREGEPRFVFKLARPGIRVALDDLEGEAVVIGTVLKKWPEGESHPLVNVPGLSLLSRDERRRMAREKGNEPQDPSMTLPGPGVTLNVLAIFR
ncbi:hypothetical protein [Barrientosiimonas humi]|uniref:DUF6414 family protein n=1 Tax=Barrientosiimonas humi TaxID=999931 RepID=UPI00370D6866